MIEAVPLTTEPLPVKLRVEDYLTLDRLGSLDAYARTELIDGRIVYTNVRHKPRARITSRLALVLGNALLESASGLEALIGGSVAMPPHDVPVPDIAITNEPEGTGLIPLDSLALVVEVADATLRHDLGRKQAVYARAGVPEYWVVDVNAGVIHQMWAPSVENYAERRQIAFGERLDAATVAGLCVDTGGL
ncbi:Uma2 family endonuclease [Sphingomonas aracearum]|uniref:Uma2 family endonuclease n=1 Tax=Sphingomonas aracearum TaxID=2283317 RepID=A0A369W379_9SPHN|nr:Uma2 family endonuclease [Sphingomonas aracearum]RDE06521.1 Uma2 family endonuclease [Sphingomonas aracearum]